MLMIEKELNTAEQATGYGAHLAKQHAAQLNKINEKLYSPAQKKEGYRVAKRLIDAYGFDQSYINYRQKFIAVKLSRPVTKNWNLARDLDRQFDSKGYVKANTEQGMIIRIPRVKKV
jgi:hypothetical protein